MQEKHEKIINNKINKLNQDNKEFLKKQMEEKRLRMGKMTEEEYRLNKGIISKVAEHKMKTGGSSVSGEWLRSNQNWMGATNPLV